MIVTILANITVIYFLTCLYYLIMTRNIGTPFKDSLSEHQIILKEKAKIERKSIFVDGLIISFLLIFIIYRYQGKISIIQ